MPTTFSNSAFTTLQRLFKPRSQPRERCELCGEVIPLDHDHLLELGTRRLLCACRACALLFQGPAARKYRDVPRQVRYLQGFRLTDAEWNHLTIPINVAFIYRMQQSQQIVAAYPSPAGAIENPLTEDAWQAIAQRHSRLAQIQPEVEALLVNRLGKQHENVEEEYYLAPIDRCYQLVGLLRTHWRGLSGGSEVWREFRNFFSDLRAQAVVDEEVTHA